MALAVPVVGATGCSGPSTDPSIEGSGSSPSAVESTTPDGGPRYRPPEQMCDLVDLTALKDLYPEEEGEDQHLLNSDQSCATAAIAGPGRVLGLSVEVRLTSDSAYEELPTLPRTNFEDEKQFAPTTPTDIDGVGSAAAWYGGEYEMWLITYDGNANLKIWAYAVNGTHALAPDMPERLVQVAAATLAALAE